MAQTILLVENEPTFQKLYGQALEAAGYHVVLAERGHQAALLAQEIKPDLVLLNLATISPVEVDVVPRLQHSAPHLALPVVAYSVLSEADDIQRALKLGASDYFVHGRSAAPEMLRKVAYQLAVEHQNPFTN